MTDKVDLNVASKESVAFEMAKHLDTISFDDPEKTEKFLELYSKCLKTVKGHREGTTKII